jgi:hypothetical protein
MMRRFVGLVGFGAVVLLMAGCTAPHSPAQPPSPTTTSAAPAARLCPVTPPTQDGIPVAITSQQYSAPVFNEGNLWVGAWWDDPQFIKQARKKGIVGSQSYGYKYPTWKVLDGKVTGAGGTPRISVKSLDGHGRGSGQVGGYTNETMDDGTVAYWWPTVAGFSSPGCWQVTETLSDDTLVYAVEI